MDNQPRLKIFNLNIILTCNICTECYQGIQTSLGQEHNPNPNPDPNPNPETML